MTVCEICDMLRNELYDNGYEYGFYQDGIKYRPDMSSGFDNRYDHLARTIYRVQQPFVTMREKCGTCIDAILVMRELLNNCGIENKMWLLYNRESNRPHTVLTFHAEERTVYLELTPQSSKPWYGKEQIYPSDDAFITEYRNTGYEVYDITDSVVPNEPPLFLFPQYE